MTETDFEDGRLRYESSRADKGPELNLADWDDGYLAFSNAEVRLGALGLPPWARLIDGRISGVAGVEGFLMEAGLWRRRGATIEEICIEREDRGFFVQRWRLETRPAGGETPNCYFRPAPTRPRPGCRLFSDKALSTLEVVSPDTRLHFFITCAGSKE